MDTVSRRKSKHNVSNQSDLPINPIFLHKCDRVLIIS